MNRVRFSPILLSLVLLLLAACSQVAVPLPEAVTEGFFKVKEVSVGLLHTCGLKTDGSVAY